MSAASLLAGLSALAVMGAAWRLRPAPARVRALSAAIADARDRPPTAQRWVARIGGLVARGVRPGTPVRDPARLGRAILAGAATLVVVPPLAPAVAALAWGLPAVRRRREARRYAAAIAAAVPETVDLFSVAIAGGLSVHLAVDAVADRAPSPVGDGLQAAVRRTRLGAPLADALEDLASAAGDPVRPLVNALVASERYGAALVESLDRLSADARDHQRRCAEAAARRVPVKLLFPLVLCVLPAFALLTVAPLVASALGSLRL